MAEVFGLITGVLQTIAAVDRAVEIFGRLQNAPKQIRLLSILLAQIERHLSILKKSYGYNDDDDDKEAGGINNHHPALPQIPPATIAEIKDSLKECHAFVKRHNKDFSDKASRVRKFWSSVNHMGELGQIRARIAEINPLIIQPLMMELLLARIPVPIHQHQGRGVPLPLRPMARDGAGSSRAPPPCDTCGRATAAATAAALNGTRAPIPENVRRQDEVQQVQQELNAALAIDLRDVLETGAVAVDTALKVLRGATLYALCPLLKH